MKSIKGLVKIDRNLFLIFVFTVLDASFIGAFLVPFLKYKIDNIALVSIVILMKNFTRIIMDIPAGMFFDKFGARTTLFLARISRIIAILIIMHSSNTYAFVVSMIFYGLSMCLTYGKINAYIYNYLESENKTDSYKQVISLYYFICSITFFCVGPIAILLYKTTNSYNVLSVLTICTTFLSMFLLFFLPKIEHIKIIKNHNFAVKKVVKYFAKDKSVVFLFLLLSFIQFILWQNANIISLFLSFQGFDGYMVVLSHNCIFVLVSLGHFLSYRYQYQVNVNNSVNWLIFLFFSFFLASINIALTIICCFICLTYMPFVLSSIDRLLEGKIDSIYRSSVSSVSTFLSSCFNVLFTFVFGLVSNYFGPLIGLNAVLFSLLLLLFYLKVIVVYNDSKI